jgi:ubiquinone/menaquinone biosynthesis C-methylase UbiE
MGGNRSVDSAEIRGRIEDATRRRNDRIAAWDEIFAKIEDASPDGLAPIDQLHSGGIAATRLLAKLARIDRGERILDVGCGVGGPARVLAREFGANVTGIDLAGGLIQVAERLGELSGSPVTFRQADALELPFDDASFDIVWTQHATTTIPDKPRLYSEIRRVLRPGGRLAVHDLVRGQTAGHLHMPIPPSDSEEETFLATADELRTLLSVSGFQERLWRDRTAPTIAFFANFPDPGAFSIRLIKGEAYPQMVDNLRRNLEEGRIAAVMGLFDAV